MVVGVGIAVLGGDVVNSRASAAGPPVSIMGGVVRICG